MLIQTNDENINTLLNYTVCNRVHFFSFSTIQMPKDASVMRARGVLMVKKLNNNVL